MTAGFQRVGRDLERRSQVGFNRGEIRVKATNIGVMNRKGGKSIMR